MTHDRDGCLIARRLLCVWLLVLGQTVALGQNGAPAPAMLTVATYNVQNLLDEHNDPYIQDERTSAKTPKQIKQIVAVLRRLDADLVALQEVESEGFLRSVVREYLRNMGYRYVVVGQTNSRFGLNLALISRRPIVSVTSHRFIDLDVTDGPAAGKRFARDLMQVRIQVAPDAVLDVFVVHFKSKRSSRNDPKSAARRLAEAVTARRIIQNSFADRPASAMAILIGDLNDVPDSAPLRALLDPVGDGGASGDGAPLLVDLHAKLPAQQRVTYLKKPYRSTIDYILASKAMAHAVVAGSARVVLDKQLLKGSDHAPVIAVFDLDRLAAAQAQADTWSRRVPAEP